MESEIIASKFLHKMLTYGAIPKAVFVLSTYSLMKNELLFDSSLNIYIYLFAYNVDAIQY